MALANFMRLSLMKAHMQVLVAPRAGNPDTGAEEVLFEFFRLTAPQSLRKRQFKSDTK
jgi:hypothetical protein